jgi:hypothetical protein
MFSIKIALVERDLTDIPVGSAPDVDRLWYSTVTFAHRRFEKSVAVYGSY